MLVTHQLPFGVAQFYLEGLASVNRTATAHRDIY